MIMERITKEGVLKDSIDKRKSGGNRKHPYRRCFAQYSGISGKCGHFKVPFLNCTTVFEAQTGLELRKDQYSCGYFMYIKDEDELKKIVDWVEKQGGLVYLNDHLSLSIALGFNFYKDENGKRVRTDLGELEYSAKYQKNEESIERIVEKIIETIDFISFYKEADFVCAVPAFPSKHFDLPREIVSRVSQKISKPNITDHFEFKQEKSPLKGCNLEEKWKKWEDTGVLFKRNIRGKTVLLIDDLYQSGISLQYIAMKLQDAGCEEVYGLTVVKSWSDTDNNIYHEELDG